MVQASLGINQDLISKKKNNNTKKAGGVAQW
jgi:hypothetical protein